MSRVQRRGARPYAACACGRIYTIDEWRALRLVGIEDYVVERQELRNCACGSTMATSTPLVRVTYAVEPAGAGFVIWRRASMREELAIGLGRGPWARVLHSRSSAAAVVEDQQRIDRGAARRLGAEIVGDDEDAA
jgi:hypothetical protein